jgi:hypothetical protein
MACVMASEYQRRGRNATRTSTCALCGPILSRTYTTSPARLGFGKPPPRNPSQGSSSKIGS